MSKIDSLSPHVISDLHSVLTFGAGSVRSDVFAAFVEDNFIYISSFFDNSEYQRSIIFAKYIRFLETHEFDPSSEG